MYAIVVDGITQSIEEGDIPEGGYPIQEVRPVFDPRYQSVAAPVDPIASPESYTFADGVVSRHWVVVSSWVRVQKVIASILVQTNWSQLVDTPAETQEAYAAYRAAVRAIPTTYAANINGIVWPVVPTEAQ